MSSSVYLVGISQASFPATSMRWHSRTSCIFSLFGWSVHKTPNPCLSSCGWWVPWNKDPCLFLEDPDETRWPKSQSCRYLPTGLVPGSSPVNSEFTDLWSSSSFGVFLTCFISVPSPTANLSWETLRETNCLWQEVLYQLSTVRCDMVRYSGTMVLLWFGQDLHKKAVWNIPIHVTWKHNLFISCKIQVEQWWLTSQLNVCIQKTISKYTGLFNMRSREWNKYRENAESIRMLQASFLFPKILWPSQSNSPKVGTVNSIQLIEPLPVLSIKKTPSLSRLRHFVL